MNTFFQTGATKPYAFRRTQLLKLRDAIIRHEDEIHNALQQDLGKSPEESYVTETGFVLTELRYALSRLKQWMRPEYVPTNLLNFPSTSKILPIPLGTVLIIGPWNYPFQLLFAPLIGAIAAGNCVVLKPSEFAPATTAVMKTIIEECFTADYIRFVEGDGSVVVPRLMREQRFDHVFYTGSTGIGREIYKMAAEQLTPVTLELGGKSPCVVTANADIRIAARRIAMTKCSNAGQMCVAPDYVLVHRSVKDQLVKALKEAILTFFTNDPATSEYYGHIINERQFLRLTAYLKTANILHGGNYDADKLFIAPTIVDEPALDNALMQDEIFGPILPIISFEKMEDALATINAHADPLAFYIYTKDHKEADQWIDAVPSGGACINNCSWHLTNPNLPFGGRGNSGIGSYHGRNSFDTFSQRRATMNTPRWFDPALKYPPFKGKMKLFKWLMRL